ncbi:MAG: vWA domain-containing protein [Rhodospirillales bacterium]
MTASVPLVAESGRIGENVMHFARVLRKAGLPVGPGRVIDALKAIAVVGIIRRDDLYWTLHAVFVSRRDQRELFDQAFHVFWRNPRILERLQALLLPAMRVEDPNIAPEAISRRIAEAMANKALGSGERKSKTEKIEFDAVLTWSQDEVLRAKDFEKMSADEVTKARSLIKRMHLPIVDIITRRFRGDPSGDRIDMRRTLRAALRSGGTIPLMFRKRRTCRPPLVVLCDISGSMDRYSRMLLHFLHALTNDRDRVHTFLFGTRLTNVTRYLRDKDIDISLDRCSKAVEDWSGGTRIGQSLQTFNRDWSRRVLGQGAVVLLISDGLDRDGADGVAGEMERLHKSCRRLIWLNPLLRFNGFEPKTGGARAILPHVDDFRSIHNLQSLTELADVLGREGPRRHAGMAKWREMAA